MPEQAEGPSVDNWSERDQRIIVSQPAAGFLYDLILRAKIDAKPDEVYAVLVDPKSHEIFRGIKDTLSRTTLQDDGKGLRKLRVGHRAVTKFLWISVTFDTELLVWEDDNARTIRFTNARSDGFMKKFDGMWHVQPFNQQTLDGIFQPAAQLQQQDHPHCQQQQHQGRWLSPSGALTVLQQRLHHSKQADDATLVTLEQALSPKARPPGPVSHLVRGLCARVLQNMMADLRKEVHRRQQLQVAYSSQQGTTKAAKPPPLSVACITSCNSSSSWQWGSSSSCSGGSGCGLMLDLLAAAVPLDITIRL